MRGEGAPQERDAVTAAAIWRETGRVLAEVRRDELRRLTDADVVSALDDLLELVQYLPAPGTTSGLVEQQRIFARLRR